MARGVAVFGPVQAVSRAVEVVEPFCFYRVVVGVVVVRISRVYCEVVIGFVLREGVEPAVANEDIFELDLVRSGYIFGVLLQDVFYITLEPGPHRVNGGYHLRASPLNTGA